MIQAYSPNNLETEKALLAIMAHSKYAIEEAIERGVNDDCFFDEKHLKVWEAISGLYNEGKEVDLVTLDERIGKRIDNVGAFLSGLYEKAGSISMVKTYAETAVKYKELRELSRLSTTIINQIEMKEYQGIFEIAESGFLKLNESRTMAMQAITDGISEFQADLETRLKHTNMIRGIHTGFKFLDAQISGLNPGCLYVVSGPTGGGKSALCANIAEYVAHEYPVYYVTLEMTASQFIGRLIARRTRINSYKVNNPLMLSPTELQEVREECLKMKAIKLKFSDAYEATLSRIKTMARTEKRNRGIKLMVIDHLGLITLDYAHGKSKAIILDELMKGLKGLAKELDIAIIVAVQLNRDSDDDERPKLKELKDSSGIEQNSDVVLFIYQEKGQSKNHRKFYIAKNREGELGECEVLFEKEYSNFDEGKTITEMRENY